jgi:YidC/Oxa1 family membrane protein insertase
MGITENQIREAASLRTKTIESKANMNVSSADKEEALAKANEKKANAKAGSMAARANMVKEYNERNSRK